MPDEMSETDIACLMLQAIIERSAKEPQQERRTPARMAQHVDDAYEYARLVMCRRETPNGGKS